MDAHERRYLSLLARSFPTIEDASAEIINLSAVLNLPKGTEVFASDIHGEYDAFSHLLRNGSGSIRLKIDDVFGDTLSEQQKNQLATLVYYPREKMELLLAELSDKNAWYEETIERLIALLRQSVGKFSCSRIRKALPPEFAYAIEELMTQHNHAVDQHKYHQAIIASIISAGRAQAFVEALCKVIQRMAIDQLHIVGDVYDRGPAPDAIMDELEGFHHVDIQWGNHDIVWMGASLGQRGCIAHVVRNCARYGNLSILEDAYGINLLPLAAFAMRVYADDPCVAFGLKGNPNLSQREYDVNVKIQKAMAIIQFKVEGQLIDAYPEFDLDDRKLLHHIDYERGTIKLDGVEYELSDTVFPTINPADPYALTPDEEEVMQRLVAAFTQSERLKRHMRVLLNKGSLYKIHNDNLLFHASVPLNADGTLKEANIFGGTYKGRALYDQLERHVRNAFFSEDEDARTKGTDLLWWMWLSPASPLFAKSKMATFELYLIEDKAARKEVKNPFYSMLDNASIIDSIFWDFGMNPQTSRIVCGHVPVKAKDGEDPVKCGGRVLTIDGGFSSAYQPTTGIAGYTLISNSYGFVLAAHEPLESTQAAIERELDIHSTRRVLEQVDKRTLVADTDTGAELKQQVADLERLVEAYRRGEL